MAALPWFNGLLGVIQQDGDPVETGAGLNFESPLTAALNTSTGLIDVGVDLGAGAPVSLVQNEGVDMAARTKLNFRGMTITDDAGSDRTNVDLTTSPPSSTGQLAVWSNALGKWTASRTLTGSYSVIGDLAVTTFGTFQTYVAIGASPAPSGALRIGNNASFSGKTVAGAAVSIATVGTDDGIHLGDTVAVNFSIQSAGSFNVYVGATPQLSVSDTTIDAQNNNFVTTGGVTAQFFAGGGAASLGAVRLGNAATIGAAAAIFVENGTNDVQALVGIDGIIFYGANGTNGSLGNRYVVKAGCTHDFAIDTATGLTISATAANFSNGTDANFALQGNTAAMVGLNIAASNVRNIGFFNDGSGPSGGWDGMDRGLWLPDGNAAPSGNPASGLYMFGSGLGALALRSSTGNADIDAPAGALRLHANTNLQDTIGDGTRGFYGVAAVARQTLSDSATTDEVVIALDALGLVDRQVA